MFNVQRSTFNEGVRAQLWTLEVECCALDVACFYLPAIDAGASFRHLFLPRLNSDRVRLSKFASLTA